MRRREFSALVGGAVAWPITVHAQQRQLPLVCVLMATTEDDPDFLDRYRAFAEALQKAGWTDGATCGSRVAGLGVISERARKYATELVGLSPNVILANTALALQPLRQETSAIPIVFVLVYDPVTSGFVTSLAQPGGNMTGFTLGSFPSGGENDGSAKRSGDRCRSCRGPMNPDQRPHVEMWRAIQEVAPLLSVRLTASDVRGPAELEPAIKAFAGERKRGLVASRAPLLKFIVHKSLRLRPSIDCRRYTVFEAL